MLPEIQFQIEHIVLVQEVALLDSCQFTSSVGQSRYFSWRKVELHYVSSSSSEGDMHKAVVGSCCCVYPQVDFGLETPINAIVSALHVGRRNGWMVADLLSIYGTAVDNGLESLAEDRVEGLVHLDVGHIAADSKRNYLGESFHRVIASCSPFE